MSRQGHAQPLLKKDDRLGEGVNLQRWAVEQKIGDGGFAEVYEVRDCFRDNAKYAVKIDKLDKRKDVRGSTVKAEQKVLKQLQGCPHVCRLVEYGYGIFHGRNFIVMERLGMNLTQYLFEHPHKRLPAPAVKHIGLEMLSALEEVHRAGWIHRDVKPANFVELVNPGAVSSWRIIDFGIARRYLTEDGSLIPKRDAFGEFRGSTTYASLNAHMKQDLGRRDDLWSWLYILVEMLEGSLPWRMNGSKSGGSETSAETDPKSAAMRLKKRCLEEPDQLSVTGKLPENFVAISRYLQGLSFEDEPNYNTLRQCLEMMPSSIRGEHPAAAMPNGQQSSTANGQHAMRAPPAQQIPTPRQRVQSHGQAQWNGWQSANPTAAGAGMNGDVPPAMQPGQGRACPSRNTPRPLGPPIMAPLPPNPAGSMPLSAVQQHAAYGWQPNGPVPYSHMQQFYSYSPSHHGGPEYAHAMQASTQHAQLMRQDAARKITMGHWGGASGQHSACYYRDAQSSGPSFQSSIDELGHLGSAFDDDDFVIAEEPRPVMPLSQVRARKRPADSEPELPDAKRRLVQQAQRAAPVAVTANGTPADGFSGQGSKVMRTLADRVTPGELTQEGSEVKEKLRKLPPAEGVSIVAWLIEALSTNVDPKGASQVATWLGCLGEFSIKCSKKLADRSLVHDTPR